MTSQELSGVAGVALSLAMSYLPGVKNWFQALDGTGKRLVMGLLLIAGAGLITLAGCYPATSPFLAGGDCTQAGWVKVVTNVLAALVANQATFVATPQQAAQ